MHWGKALKVRCHLYNSCPERTKSTAEKCLPFKHPITLIMSGPTGSSKTNYVVHLTDNVNAMIKPTPDMIVYYFAKYQPLFDCYTNVKFCNGMRKSTK